MSEAQLKKAIRAINEEGVLLVFPIKNKKDPNSIWRCLYPKSEMRWEWDENGDSRVANLWHMREQLSRSQEVVYSKWYQGRATFFSKEVFVHVLAWSRAADFRERLDSREAGQIMEALEMDSPLSTKQIKEIAELQGRNFESTYNRVMKSLWLRGLIVGFGEVQDSSFPSLAVGAAKTLFEDLWAKAEKTSPQIAGEFLRKKLGEDNLFYKFLLKQRAKPPAGPAPSELFPASES